VLLASGVVKPISEIEVGDVVWAADPETGEEGPRTVEGVWPHEDWLLDLDLVAAYGAQATGEKFLVTPQA
jgi:hypothetical protein